MSFGKRLRQLRLDQRLTQRALAERVAVDFTYLSKLENDRMDRPPSEDLLRRLAEALETDADELIQLAQRVPRDVAEIVVQRPEAAELLRSMNKLTREEWIEMVQEAKKRGEGR